MQVRKKTKTLLTIWNIFQLDKVHADSCTYHSCISTNETHTLKSMISKRQIHPSEAIHINTAAAQHSRSKATWIYYVNVQSNVTLLRYLSCFLRWRCLVTGLWNKCVEISISSSNTNITAEAAWLVIKLLLRSRKKSTACSHKLKKKKKEGVQGEKNSNKYRRRLLPTCSHAHLHAKERHWIQSL